MPTDEEKLLAILNQPGDVLPNGDDLALCVVDETQVTMVNRLLGGEMPSPEEIIRDAKNAKHNDAISQQRQEKLARREARRAKNPKRRRRR